jgi:hypothetical protein
MIWITNNPALVGACSSLCKMDKHTGQWSDQKHEPIKQSSKYPPSGMVAYQKVAGTGSQSNKWEAVSYLARVDLLEEAVLTPAEDLGFWTEDSDPTTASFGLDMNNYPGPISHFTVIGRWLEPDSNGYWVPVNRRQMGDIPWFITFGVANVWQRPENSVQPPAAVGTKSGQA